MTDKKMKDKYKDDGVNIDAGDAFSKYLARKGIGTVIHYPVPIHKQKAFSEWKNRKYPITEQIHDTIISIPLNPALTNNQVKTIIKACNDY